MTVQTVAVPLTGADQAVAIAGPGEYVGFTIRETMGATALVKIFDNASAAAGTILDTIGLSANESVRENYPHPVRFAAGVYVHVVSGSVEGSVRIG